MPKTNYRLRAETTLAIPLDCAERALQQAAASIANGLTPMTGGSTTGIIGFRHWTLRSLGLCFTASQVNNDHTHIDLSLNLYLARVPFARYYFEKFVVKKLTAELHRFSWLSETLAKGRQAHCESQSPFQSLSPKTSPQAPASRLDLGRVHLGVSCVALKLLSRRS